MSKAERQGKLKFLASKYNVGFDADRRAVQPNAITGKRIWPKKATIIA